MLLAERKQHIRLLDTGIHMQTCVLLLCAEYDMTLCFISYFGRMSSIARHAYIIGRWTFPVQPCIGIEHGCKGMIRWLVFVVLV